MSKFHSQRSNLFGTATATAAFNRGGAAAAAAAAAAANFWNNTTDSIQYLAPILESSPSIDGLLRLYNVDQITSSSTIIHPSVATLYLQCAAKQLMFSMHAFHTTATTPSQSMNHAMQEEQCKNIICSIAETAAKVAPICVANQKRSIISQSGILVALLHQMREANSEHLSIPAVEFLQCSLLAGQYRFAAKILKDLWPRPPTNQNLDVVWILRYYYLRGIIHIGCDDYQMAIRSFWTCLCIPSEIVSAIAIDAWKKMILCKAITANTTTLKLNKQTAMSVLSTPPAASNAISRFFDNSSNTSFEPLLVSAMPQQQQENATDITRYMELIKADSREKYAQIKDQNKALWESDQTMGLVLRLERELEYRWIRYQAKIFSVLPLSKLSTDLGHSSHDQTLSILKMVDGIQYTIDDDEFIVFEPILDVPMPTQNLQQLMQLAERVRHLDATIACSAKYRQQVKNIDTASVGRACMDDF